MASIKPYLEDRKGVASIEAAFTFPLFIMIFLLCLQLVFLLLAQTTLNTGIQNVITTYSNMHIRQQTPLSDEGVKALLCSKMVLYGDCDKRISVQLHSYSSPEISELKIPRQSNDWAGLDKYYVSFVRVDYPVPNIIPYFSSLMRIVHKEYLLSEIFIVTPSQIRTQSI